MHDSKIHENLDKALILYAFARPNVRIQSPPVSCAYGDRRVGTFDIELIKKPGSQHGDQAGNRNLLPRPLVNQAWLYFARLNVDLTTQIISDTFRRRPNLYEAPNKRNYRHLQVAYRWTCYGQL